MTRLNRILSLSLILLLIGGGLAALPTPSLAAPAFRAAATDVYADAQTGQATFMTRDNTIPAATMNVPTGVAVGNYSNTNVIALVADRDNNRVLLYNLTVDDPGLNDAFPQPQDDSLPTMANIQGIYGQIDSAITTPGTSPSTLNHPAGVAIAPTTSSANPKVYIADTGNNRVLIFNTLPTAVGSTNNADLVLGQSSFIGFNPGSGLGQMSSPQGVAVDKSSRVYVADTGNDRIQVFNNPNTSGQSASFVIGGTSGAGASQLNAPAGVAVDADGNLYVADTGNNRVLKYNAPLSGGMSASKVYGQSGFGDGAPGTSATTMRGPTSVAVDSLGNLYVADAGNHRALLFFQSATNSDTTADRVFGQNEGFSTGAANNGTVSALGSPDYDTLNSPAGVAVNPNVISAANESKDYRDLFVADSNNHRVLQYWTPTSNPAPTLTSPTFAPAVGTATLGNAGATVPVRIYGKDFASGATVDWNGTTIPSTSVFPETSTRLRVEVSDTLFDALTTADLPTAGQPIKVTNPAALRFPNLPKLASGTADFPICFDKPLIGTNNKFGITPDTAEAGSPGFTLTITGTNFIKNPLPPPDFPMSISWDGALLASSTVTLGPPDELTVFVPIEQLAQPGDISIALSNFLPDPAGACAAFSASKLRTFKLTSPDPTITSFVPTSVNAGWDTALDLVIKGTGFVTGDSKTQVYFDGVLYPTAVINSSTEILLPGIPASKFSIERDIPVRVVNPPISSSPVDGGEDEKAFPVVGKTDPVITRLVPDEKPAGSDPFPLDIYGKNFSAGTKVYWDGEERTVLGFREVASETILTVIISSEDVKLAGTADVTVDDPTDALPVSEPATFKITSTGTTPQTINFIQPSDTPLSTGVMNLVATATSGLQVKFESKTTSICTVSGSQATLLATGTCIIRATQDGDNTYAAAPAVTRSFEVTPDDMPYNVMLPLIIR